MTNEITCAVLDDCSFIIVDPGGSSFYGDFHMSRDIVGDDCGKMSLGIWLQ